MAGRIFAIRDDGTLLPLDEEPYELEDRLQALIADYPDLLAGEQMRPDGARQWLLIRREMPIPDADEGNARWSADHLFLDQDGIATIVEVKRSTDSRIRREVVGQMLDYAANAVVYWPPESIRDTFERSTNGADPDDVLTSVFGGDVDSDTYWELVRTNLQAQKVRMVFVADVIPAELRRIVEFLNGQMDPAEVLAVEVRQYVGEGLRTLVPRVIGVTAEAEQQKGRRKPSRQWDAQSFDAQLEDQVGADAVSTARAIRDWAAQQRLRLVWGKGAVDGTFRIDTITADGASRVFMVYTNGRVELPFQRMAGPFEDLGARRQLAERLAAVPGFTIIEDDGLDRWPGYPIELLSADDNLATFLRVWEWYLASQHAGDLA